MSMAVDTFRSKQRRERLWAWCLPIAVFGLVAGLWEASTINLESLIIPTFSETAVGFYELAFQSGRLWEPLLVSNQALVVGYLLSVALALPLGLGMARARWLESLAE